MGLSLRSAYPPEQSYRNLFKWQRRPQAFLYKPPVLLPHQGRIVDKQDNRRGAHRNLGGVEDLGLAALFAGHGLLSGQRFLNGTIELARRDPLAGLFEEALGQFDS